MLHTPNGAIALKKEWQRMEKKEYFLWVKACQVTQAPEVPIPPKLQSALEAGFCKAFGIVLNKGTGLLEKTYSKEKIQAEYRAKERQVLQEETRRSLRRIPKGGRLGHVQNLLLTSAEGIGLGLLGIGLPDIVLFLTLLLKGIYETALRYGFDYDTSEEKMLILKMMQCALSKQGEWKKCNEEINGILEHSMTSVQKEELEAQLEATAHTFALDMLLLKTIQTLPVIGILGGISNPVYYRKMMNYVELKYLRRYLLRMQRGEIENDFSTRSNQTGGV